MDKAELVKHFRFLDSIRSDGKINMFGAAQALVDGMGLDKATARKVHVAWMETFDDELTAEQRAEKVTI